MRPIDGDNLEEQIIQLQEDTDCYQNPSEVTDVLDYVLQLLDKQPTIEAKPVVHGRWIKTIEGKPESGGTLGKFTCNLCNKSTWATAADGELNFCPNCGAKMDKEE